MEKQEQTAKDRKYIMKMFPFLNHLINFSGPLKGIERRVCVISHRR